MTTIFIGGTGTGVGKTWVSRGIARALSRRRADVVALKPLETGCDPDPQDAIALATACGRPELARAPGLYRARLPLAPWAATLEGEPPPDVSAIVESCRAWLEPARVGLVEGAGGLLVPIDEQRDMLDLARALDAAVVLVARDALGVLSDVLSSHALASARGARVAAVVLTRFGDPDPSQRTNRRILAARLPCPMVSFETRAGDDDCLADAAAPVLRALGLER